MTYHLVGTFTNELDGFTATAFDILISSTFNSGNEYTATGADGSIFYSDRPTSRLVQIIAPGGFDFNDNIWKPLNNVNTEVIFSNSGLGIRDIDNGIKYNFFSVTSSGELGNNFTENDQQVGPFSTADPIITQACFLIGTLIKIPDGFEKIENLKPGDSVISNGEIIKVKRLIINLYGGKKNNPFELKYNNLITYISAGHAFKINDYWYTVHTKLPKDYSCIQISTEKLKTIVEKNKPIYYNLELDTDKPRDIATLNINEIEFESFSTEKLFIKNGKIFRDI